MNVLGIDIGQSHTRAVVVSHGKVVELAEGPSCFLEDVDAAVSVANGLSATLTALSVPIDCIGVGTTGSELPEFVRTVDNYLRANFPGVPIQIVDDGMAAHLGAFMGRDGLLLIAGTGSVARGKYNGRWEKVGGHGFLVGDEGSGVWIGKEALRLALRSADCMEPPTILGDALCAHFGVDALDEVKRLVRRRPQRLASFAKVVLESEDELASRIVQDAAMHLASTMAGICKKVGAEDGVATVLTGGIAKSPRLKAAYDKALASVMPCSYRDVQPMAGPEIGATLLFAKEAAWHV